ncbi:MBOAT family O-acyltransferase [Tenacibaculum xiamenense]|uniref:MBOAT family O-acyltransferase n=1 Tax=Tenacibaculum xiamenense TaxID=1261553 RepID=UPI0038946122
MEILFVILLISIPLIVLAWTLPEKWQLFPICLATFFFLGYYSPISLFILIFTSIFNYYIINQFLPVSKASVVVIVQMVIIFLFFKLNLKNYFDPSNDILIPLGLSYYSFRQIQYAIESYKRQLPKHNLFEFLQYMFFLPTILVGPINRFQPFLKYINRRRWDESLFSNGLELILYGLVKVTFLGNYLISTKLNNYVLINLNKEDWGFNYLNTIKFYLNAYFQFAGYSDIAIGLALLFGFKIIENFNYPFLAQNISDFWDRWHISLSSWCKDYIFLPFLSITRSLKLSIIITMTIIGLWHEISFRYILWAFLHALGINIWYKYQKSKINLKLTSYPLIKKLLGIFITFHFVAFSFVLISEKSFSQSIEILKILFFLNYV